MSAADDDTDEDDVVISVAALDTIDDEDVSNNVVADGTFDDTFDDNDADRDVKKKNSQVKQLALKLCKTNKVNTDKNLKLIRKSRHGLLSAGYSECLQSIFCINTSLKYSN